MLDAQVAVGTASRTERSAHRFWYRLVETFFRRWPFYLAPVVLMGALGFSLSSSTVPTYMATGTLSASSNPLVTEQTVRGTALNNYESPASGTARVINEQLRTDAFVEAVAERAGVTGALESGIVTLDDMRASVWAAPNGDTLLKVNSQWSDPETSLRLADATISSYLDYVLQTVASDSSAAQEYYTEIMQDSLANADAAQVELDSYLSTLPPVADGDERPIEQQLKIQRLNNALDTAEAQVASAQDAIQTAEVTLKQAQSKAGEVLRVVDAPKLPTLPESTAMTKIMKIITFLVLGTLIAAGALVGATLLDQSVRSADDIVLATGHTVVATVPLIKKLRSPNRKPGSGKPKRSRAPAPA